MVVILLNGFYRCTTYATLFLNADQLSVKQVCDVGVKFLHENILAWSCALGNVVSSSWLLNEAILL